MEERECRRKSEKWKREHRMTNFLGKIQTCLVNSFLLVYTNTEQPKHGSPLGNNNICLVAQ
jgi:hypothetical protein